VDPFPTLVLLLWLVEPHSILEFFDNVVAG